jgi:hypothetical protein
MEIRQNTGSDGGGVHALNFKSLSRRQNVGEDPDDLRGFGRIGRVGINADMNGFGHQDRRQKKNGKREN